MVGSKFAMHPFGLRAERLNGFVRLAVSGELDLFTAQRLEDSLAHLQREHGTVIVDLTDLEFMGVDGVRVFLDASSRARSTGGAVLITNCWGPARRVFDLTSTSDLLDGPEVAELLDDGRHWTPMDLTVGVGAPRVADR